MRTMIRNGWTTLLGIFAGVVNYLQTVGPDLPTDRKGWTALLFSALIAGLGVVSKDATTGSRPGEEEAAWRER